MGGAALVSNPRKPRPKRKPPAPQVELNLNETIRIKAHLFTLACTDNWVDHIVDMLIARDRRGKRIIPYVTDKLGRLKTKLPKLLAAIAEAGIYPPAADDLPRGYRNGGIEHLGSSMRPCLCDDCTTDNRAAGGGVRHVMWPASYMVHDHLSYTCAVNKQTMDPDLVEAIDPGSELLADMGRGRIVTPGEAAGEMRVDANAWRMDALYSETWNPLNLTSFGAATLKRHRWTQIVGDVSIDSLGRETNNVRKSIRGLANIGSLVDFLELGHKLTSVEGLDPISAEYITAAALSYPREPRMKPVSIRWRKTRTGTRR